MEVNPKELRIYEAADGSIPFADWLDGLRDGKGRAVIRVRIDRMAAGNFGDHASVGGGIFELRIHFGPGYRIYFAEDGPRLVLLLLGGDKKSQSLDIARAKSYWKTYKQEGP